MNKLNIILAGIDFSDCSRSALEQAVRLAKWNNARLHALPPKVVWTKLTARNSTQPTDSDPCGPGRARHENDCAA